ncbi:MAG: hypothetical protein KJ850_04255 [Gammaproteobacteria bacterium]|nr:hypothetical protein [Gammaproteobacteria bacterium]MBU1624242.1 hypothetical protein [Gammaproteobacteria bacterium]MBU1981970.1 hypothetical protein [Gammaproteobacteria bacterium]
MNDTLTVAAAAAFESLVAPQPLVAHKSALDFKTFCSLRRMVSHQRKQWVVGSSDFMQLLALHLPEVAEHVDESDFGYIHLEVGVLRIASRTAILCRDMSELLRHLILVSDLLGRADQTLHDALRVSYLEALFLGETGSETMVARGMLPKMMEDVLRKSESRMGSMRAAV